ncbi:MAG: hypothetical protein GXY44_05775 [Phycisphaerales bacterium]|nr:hypothetical protein [Phycisphaerales bacterium]
MSSMTATSWRLVLIGMLALAAPTMSQDIVINEFMAVNSDISALRPLPSLNLFTIVNGEHVYEDWIELHNLSDETIDLAGWYLTDNTNNLTKWQFPAGYSIAPNGYLVVYASKKEVAKYGYPFVDDLGKLHTTFALSREGECVALVRPDGVTIEHAHSNYPMQRGLVSYGIGADSNTGYLTGVTIGAANTGTHAGVVDQPSFSVTRGFYETPFLVHLTCATPGAVIRYTIDTSEPTASTGIIYNPSQPIAVASTTCLRAAAFKSGYLSSTIVTHTYIFLNQVLVQATNPSTGEQVVPTGYPAIWPGGTYKEQPGDYQVDPDIASPSGLFGHLYAATLKSDLQAVPTVSVVVPLEHFFGSPMGIYTHENQDGTERAGSVEFIDPTGTEAFATNCGVRMQGGSSLFRWSIFKLSLRLRFRGGYGGSLDYPLFGEHAASSFENLILDARHNMTWAYDGDVVQKVRATYVRDRVAADLQLAMGGYASQGRPIHLYLNGLYWGMYWVQERPDHWFAASYLGGDGEDYDALKHNANTVVKGSNDDYLAMFALSATAPDPITALDNLRQQLAVEEFIDYMIANFYLGNADWDGSNWFASCNRFDPAGRWRWHMWDAEHCLDTGYVWLPTEDVTTKNNPMAPTGLHQKWIANPEYRMLFADRAHKHMFNNGVLTPSNFAALFANRVNEIDRAIVGESARWGDTRRPTGPPYTRNNEWLTECNRLLQQYIPGRTNTVLGQFTSKNPAWYPSVGAPAFLINGQSMHGGDASIDDTLTIQNPNASGTVYYTKNGDDPRLPGGGVSPSALIYNSDITLTGPLAIKARILHNGTWSALNEAAYTCPASLLHYWHCNSLPSGTLTTIMSEYSIIPGDQITYPGSGSGYMDRVDPGTTLNARMDQPAGYALRVRNPSNTRELLLKLPTTGYQYISLSYAVTRTVNGAQTQSIYYRLGDQEPWIPRAEEIEITEQYQTYSFDFSGIPGVNDNPEFAVRIMFGGSNASGTEGNNRFDNIAMEGLPMEGTNQPPQPAEAIPFTEAVVGTPTLVNLSSRFIDPDGDVLIFSAEADKPLVVEPTVSGNVLTLAPLYQGDAVITVTADDGYNSPVAITFRVLVYPAAWNLNQGGFSFTEWDPTHAEHVFPENILFLQSDESDPDLNSPLQFAYFIPHDDYHDDDSNTIGFPYNATRRTRLNGLGEDGISFINTGRERDLGGALLAVNTQGAPWVSVGWTAGTVLQNSRVYGLRLQYRLGITGEFSDVLRDDQPVEYVAGPNGEIQTMQTAMLPAAALNQPYVQILWRYYHKMGESGARAELRLDDLIVGAPRVPADFDGDGDVDLEDFGLLQRCYNMSPATGDCAKADLYPDGVINQDDFAVFQACLSGAGNLANIYCSP